MSKKIALISNGYVWHIDALAVAESYAMHYADEEDSYDSLIQEVLDDEYELIDWYQNNMNWSDIPDDRKHLVESPPVVYSPEQLVEYRDAEFTFKLVEL